VGVRKPKIRTMTKVERMKRKRKTIERKMWKTMEYIRA
jgi:hypothetical protein